MPNTRTERRTEKSRRPKAKKKTANPLRTLRNEEAFYFYEDLGRPTGKSANSLADFQEKLESIKTESVLFHLQRKDFQNWIEKTLGDQKLARKIEKIPLSNDESLKIKVRKAVGNRIKELTEPSTTLLVSEDLTVTR
jgi:hypothetical protein